MRSLEPGDPRAVGDYRLLKRLGSGGMGEVFFGVSPGGRRVAVKLVRPELMSRPEFRPRFRREVLANRLVNGAYTAPVIDAEPDASPPWLVTSFIPGPSLQQTVGEHGPLPARTVLTLAAGLAEALVSIHDIGLIHRDVKPSNVLLAEDGPRLIDFGIARLSEATRITRTEHTIGSPGFISPEQVDGGEIGPASDVFSLGSVLAYAATGSGPFGEGPFSIMLYRAVHEAPELSGITDTALRGLLERCLAKDPGERPTPQEIITETGFAAGPTVLLGTEGWLPVTERVRGSEQALAFAETVTREGTAAPLDSDQSSRPTGPDPDARPGRTRRTVLFSGLGALAAVVPAGMYLGRDLLASGPSAPEPLAAWPLDEESGTIAAEVHGRHPGRASGVRWRVGDVEAATFDGATSEIATSGPVLATGRGDEYTVSAWVRLNDKPNDFCTAVSQTAGESSAFYLQYSSDEGRWCFAAPEHRALSKRAARTNTWTHLVGVRTKRHLILYVDEVRQDHLRISDAWAATSEDSLIIGRAVSAGEARDWFPGSIRDVRVYDRALSAEEVEAIGEDQP